MLVTNAEEPIDGSIEQLLMEEIARLASHATTEINVAGTKYLQEAKALLAPDSRIYVSHVPRQKWEDTVSA